MCKPGAVPTGAEIRGANAWAWTAPAKRVSPYVQEHTDLIASIRAGKRVRMKMGQTVAGTCYLSNTSNVIFS